MLKVEHTPCRDDDTQLLSSLYVFGSNISEALDPANHQKAIMTLQRFDKDTSRQILDQQLTATRKLIQPTPEFKIGTIDVAAWKQTEKIMMDQKQISTPVNVEKVLRPWGSY